MAEMVEDIEKETKALHKEKKTRPLGARRVCRKRPHHRPKKTKWSPGPKFLAAKDRRKALWEMFQNFLVAYYAAADRLREGDLTVRFPEGCFPPGLPYVPTFADLRLRPG